MTFEEYIQNPMGEKNSVVSNRTLYRELYKKKLDQVMVRESGKVDYKAYKDGKRYLIHIKVPSEVIAEFYYDVVIEFRQPKDAKLLGADLSKYEVRFFSNDPAFVYTFAHAFRKNNLFVTDLDSKMSKEALTQKAKEKNPKEIISYVKSIYFAYLMMKSRGLFSKSLYVDTYNQKALLNDVMHADKKIDARQQAQKDLIAARKKEKQKLTDMVSKRNNQNPETPVSTFTNKVKNTMKTKTIGKMGNMNKSVGSVKKVKKIK